MASQRLGITARTRLLSCMAVGVAVAVIFVLARQARFAAIAAWDVTAILYVAAVLATVLPLDAVQTKSHALRENPGRAAGDVLLLLASLASLFAVGWLMLQAADAHGADKLLDIGLGLVSVIVSWSVIHTTYMLSYARLYYGKPEGGIDFNQPERPCYADFAYMAFTLGMTFQVSDTAISHKAVRSLVLRHALLAYVFGTVIIAATINFLAGLSK
jgi:uncharacterized membrane protein